MATLNLDIRVNAYTQVTLQHIDLSMSLTRQLGSNFEPSLQGIRGGRLREVIFIVAVASLFIFMPSVPLVKLWAQTCVFLHSEVPSYSLLIIETAIPRILHLASLMRPSLSSSPPGLCCTELWLPGVRWLLSSAATC